MRIEKIKKTCYCIIGPNKDTFSHFRTKRILRPTPEYTCYKWKNAYQLIFDSYDEEENLLKQIRADNCATHASSDLLMVYISNRFCNGLEVFNKGIKGETYECTTDGEVIYEFIVKDEATIVTDVLPEEQKEWDERKEQDINNQLLNSFFKQNLDLICKKYDLSLNTNSQGKTSICFRDRQAVAHFITKALQDTIVKEINDLGLDATLSGIAADQLQNGYCYEDLLVDGIKVDKDKLTTLQ